VAKNTRLIKEYPMKKQEELNHIVRRFIQDGGNATQSFGLGRVVGQIYAYLYFNPEPRNLADMQNTLGISKGSASTGVRQLEQWGAVHKVWVKGDRKDYYRADDWFGGILKSAMMDIFGKRMAAYNSLLNEIEAEVSEIGNGDGESKFVKNRIAHIRKFQQKTQKVWRNPVLQRLLR
jgi:DNA-binding transcriptional regulator GbsR (MarR family)